MSFFSNLKEGLDFSSKHYKVTPYIFLMLGLIFCGMGLSSFYSVYEFEKNSEDVKLKVVTVDEKISENTIVYRPVFQRLDGDSLFTTYTGDLWVDSKPHEIGNIVEGKMNLATGEMQSTKMIEENMSVGTPPTIIGLIWTSIGGIWLWKRRKKKS